MKAGANKKGFTLIEVLLVILILGMLASVGIYMLVGTRDRAKIDTTRALVETTLAQALDTYEMHLGELPTSEQGLTALVEKPAFDTEEKGAKWCGPYLKKLPKDAWDRDIHYERSEDGKTYKLWSDGPDGTSGSEDDIRNYKDDATK